MMLNERIVYDARFMTTFTDKFFAWIEEQIPNMTASELLSCWCFIEHLAHPTVDVFNVVNRAKARLVRRAGDLYTDANASMNDREQGLIETIIKTYASLPR